MRRIRKRMGVGGVDRFRTAGEGVGELGKKGRRMGSVKRS